MTEPSLKVHSITGIREITLQVKEFLPETVEEAKWVVGQGWRMIAVDRDYVYSDETITITHKAIQRDSDGFILISKGGNPIEGFEWFICKGNDIPEFEIWTDCRGLPYKPLSDTFIVDVHMSEAPRESIYKYAKNIEAGLLAYPPVNRYDYIPPKYVKFDISENLTKKHLVNAEEIQT